MAINVGDNFSYQGKKYLDNRQSFKTLSELQAYSNVPEGFIAYCEEDKKRYEYVDGVWTEYVVASSGTEVNPDCATKAYVDELIDSHTHNEYLTEHQDISHLATKAEIPSIEGLATETYVQEQIANASLGGGEGGSVDISNFATKDDLKTKFDNVEVNKEETTDSQTALDFFANGEKVKTVYFSGGGGGSAAAAYISTTLPEEAMVETGYDFDILLDFYSPNPGKGTLKVFVNDVDALSTPILQGETTTTLSHEKLTKGTNKIVVYVLDRIGTMSNSLTFYVRYGSTELVGEFDSSLSYDYGANIRYYFTATALDTSLALTFYMSIDGAVQNGVSCISDVRGYFTFPNSLEAGGHYCECWVEDSKGGKSNVEMFNLVILDTNTLAIVTETRNPSVEEGSQLVLDYRVYKKNETTFIIKTYVDEELVSTGTCGLTTSYYKTTTLREGMHNIKIEAWDMTETVSDYITWSVIITPSTYTMLEPIKAGSMFMATAKNRTNGDPNRETWTGYNQDNNAIDCTLYNFAFNSESGWMDDQLFITGNSYVEVPIQPLANNARYGFTLDVEFSTKPIGVDDAEVLSLWNDTDNCGIKITTDQLILQSKTGNKCELYFSENEIVSAIFIIDRHEKTAKVYLNGVMCAAFALSDYTAEGVSYLEDFTVNDNLYLGKPGSNGYATIKNLRIYELALSSSEILNNFMANEIDKAKQKALVEFQKGEDLPTVTVYCDFSGLGKDDKKYCDIVYNSPDPVKYGESFSLMGKYSQLQYQGTSSMQYPIKNYRLNPKDANGKVKIKLPNSQPETRFTLKADFMSSGHWQNTGLTKWINDNLYNYKEDDPKTMNPAKWWAIQNGKDPNDYRECIYGFPCRLILVNDGTSPLNEGQQEPTPGNTKDMGIFNFNLDKDCENSLGFKIKDFPNALSMEVTANSDTSAGAFMSYTSRVVDLPMFNNYDKEYISGNIPLESVIDNGTLNVRVENSDGYCVNGFIYFKDDSDTRLSSNSLQPFNSTLELTPPDGATKIMILLIRYPWGDGTLGVTKVHINGFTFNVIGSDSVVDPIIPTGDGELDYIKESFELRYPDEDDVPEGWGFMEIDGVEGGGLKALIDWVDNSTDEQFVAEFEEHFHKDYTLRYFLLVMVLGMVDNLGKNMMLDSYDGKIWMPRFYDCDTICSYDNSGAIKFDVDIEMAQGYWNTSSSRLWTRVRDLFHDELVVKYNDMRQNGLSFESLMNVFYNEQIAKIPQKYYNMDADVKYLPYADEYLGKAHGDGYEHLKRWLKNRIIFTDSLYDYAPSYTNDMITFRANTTEEMTITIETYTPVYQHVSWYNGNMQKEKIAKGTQLTFKGFAQAATDQEVLVYGGSNIKRIIGISTMNPNSMLIGNATRLVELDISDCPILTDINSNKANFTPHTYLNKLDISNCPQLGGSLRLNYSPLIGEINAMNTAITDLQLPSSIRNLHTLKVPGALTNLTLNDGPVLSTLEFDGPNNLQSVNLTNCNALTNVVNFDMTQIPSVTLNNSYDADELYMSKTTNLSLVNMANVKKLIFVPNNEHETFNLTELRNCPDYTISAINCPNLKTFMTTAGYRESYKLISFKEVVDYDNYTNVMPSNIEIQRNSWIHGDNGTLNSGGSPTSCVTYIPVNSGKTYTLGTNDSSGLLQLLIYDNNKNYQREDSVTFFGDRTMPLTFTVPDGCGFIRFHINNGTFGGSSDVFLKMYETKTIQVIDHGNVTPNTAFCANTLDISNTKITDVNFLCTTDVYQLKLPDTVNNFICDSAYDLDTDYLPDGDFDTVHHELIEAYTTDYTSNVLVPKGIERTVYEEVTPNLIPSAADGSLIFSMYAPNTNVAVPAEGIWDLYGLTFEEFYTYGMNNDIVVTDGNITMPYRCADYNITIQNANIKPTNHPTMLYPLLVNENKPIVGTIDYSDYQGDDLSYAMAYANKSEVDISIPNDVAMNSQYHYNVDTQSEYEYNDPRTIAKYTCNAKGVLPTFNSGYTAYKVAERDNGDGTYTTRIMADDISDLPTSISFAKKTGLLSVSYINTNNITTMSGMFDGCSNLVSVNMANANTTKNTSCQVMFRNCNHLASVDLSNWDLTSCRTTQQMFQGCSILNDLRLNWQNMNNITTMLSMFNGCNILSSLDVSNWDVSSVRIMSSIFQNCSKLTSLDVSNWDTSSVTDMNSMFQNCSKLTSLNISNWKTSSVTNMGGMFRGCSSLTSLDLSNWDTSSVISINSMFDGCTKLITVDLTGWNLESLSTAQLLFAFDNNLETIRGFNDIQFGELTDFYAMFYRCAKITELDLTNMHTGSAANFYNIFNGCTALKTLDLTGWDTSSVTTTSVMFAGASTLETLKWTNWKPSVDLSSCPLSAECLRDLLNNLATVENKTLTLGATNLAKVSTADILAAQLKGWKFDGDVSVAVVFASDTISGNDAVTECGIQLTSANRNTRIDEVLGAYTACTDIYLFEDGSVTSFESLFYKNNSTYKSRLTKISILPGNFGNVTKAYAAFLQCSNVTSMDINGWDTSSLRDAREMFKGCSKLASLDLSDWVTSSVTDMSYMFQNCSSLTSIDVSNWDTSSVTSMDCMFLNCSSLTSIDLSDFDTSSVTGMISMFYNCSKLASLDLSDWVTSSVTDMSYMFQNCSSLTSIDVSNWDTSSVTKMQQMFRNCSSLTSIDISNWDTGKVIDFGSFCAGCSKLTSIIGLDLSTYSANFGGAGETKFLNFRGCNSLTTIKDIDVTFTTIMGKKYSSSVSEDFWIACGWKWFKDLSNLSDITFKGQVGLWDTLSYYAILSACDTSKFTLETWESFVSIFPETPTPKSLAMGKSQANLDAVPDSIKTALINKGYTLTFIVN